STSRCSMIALPRSGATRSAQIPPNSYGATTKSYCSEIDALAYDQLRRIAVFHLRRERAQTLDPAELVSEVYLRLAGVNVELADQVHFFAIASRTMRRILVDHARKQLAAKRLGGEPLELDETHVAIDRPREAVELDEALVELVRHDERKATVTTL